jgi:hypothetical protein
VAAAQTVRGCASGSSGPSRPAAKAIDPNRLNHIFGKAEHALGSFVQASGGREQAFTRIQEAANAALREGRLTVGTNGILPRGNAGNIGSPARLVGV